MVKRKLFRSELEMGLVSVFLISYLTMDGVILFIKSSAEVVNFKLATRKAKQNEII